MNFWKQIFGPASTKLLDAARNGDLKSVESLLKRKANVYFHDAQGRQPLERAAANGHGAVVEVLLAHGADISGGWPRDGEGKGPLYLAAMNGHAEVVELLLAHGAKAKGEFERGSLGREPLFIAAEKGHKEVVRLLLARGAPANTENFVGDTVLHKVAYQGRKDIVELLLANGADVNAKDVIGKTPLCYAENQGHRDVAELLRLRGGLIPPRFREESHAILARIQSAVAKARELVSSAAKASGHYQEVKITVDKRRSDRGNEDALDDALNPFQRNMWPRQRKGWFPNKSSCLESCEYWTSEIKKEQVPDAVASALKSLFDTGFLDSAAVIWFVTEREGPSQDFDEYRTDSKNQIWPL